MDYICPKRLQPALPELVRVLERHNELHCEAVTRAKLLRISAATVDRLLRSEQRKYELGGQARTKPGTLLKHQIPIRTFAEWNEQQPGFGEIDLVGHDGGVAAGDYCQTLDFTDVATTWTETVAVRNKAQARVFEALQKVRKQLPFPLLGLDSDNGSEFINDQLLHYCRQEQITFTRSRPYRKNDNCFVEQKNYSIVRNKKAESLLTEVTQHAKELKNKENQLRGGSFRTRYGSQFRDHWFGHRSNQCTAGRERAHCKFWVFPGDDQR